MAPGRVAPSWRSMVWTFLLHSSALCWRRGQGQQLTEVPSEYGYDATNSIDGVGNSITQTYQFYAHPEKPTITAAAQAPVMNGVNNPTCLSKEKHYAYSITEEDIKETGRPFGVFVPNTHEILPVMLVTLQMNQTAGSVAVKGPGLLAEATVNRENVVRTVCGKWVLSETGYYGFEFSVLQGASARIMYFVRRRQTPEEPVLLDFPIDVEMNVSNNVIGDDLDVEIYIGVSADWITRVVDIEVEQFIADRNTYEAALEDSLVDGFEDLITPEIPEVGEYDYYYYYDTYTAPYADYYNDLDMENPVEEGAFDNLRPVGK